MSYFESLVIYIVTFVFSTVAFLIADTSKNKFLYGIGIIIPSLTAAFRQSGVDFGTYKDIFSWIKYDQADYLEEGWILLNKLSPTYEWVLFFSAFIFCGVACYAICSFLEDNRGLAWFAFLVTCYGVFLNIMRQMIAVSFVFLAFSFLLKNKKKYFIVAVLVATLFHKSAIILLLIPVYMSITKKVNKYEILILVACMFAPLFISLIEIICLRLGIFTSYFQEESNTSIAFMLYCLPPLFGYFLNRKICWANHRIRWLYKLYLLVFPLQVLGNSLAYADRIMLYFQPIIVVLVPSILNICRNKSTQMSLKIIYFLWFIVYFLFMYVFMNSNQIFPYRIG